MDSSHSSARSSVSYNSVSSDVVVESSIPSGTVLNAFTEEIVAYEKESDETHDVKNPRTKKFVLYVFDTIHNYELEREEFKHLSKRERQLTYLEQASIVKAASVNIGADEVSKYNYREFGNIVSLDATFKTNKYNMVFVSFTAIDNHKKCVTVAAGLLKNETTKSYICIGYACGTSPKSFLLSLLFFFLHIYAKIYDETDFKEKLNKIVWNLYIGPEEFEYKWGKLMEEFNLENHKWLTKMFNIRSTWIPAYFTDSSLCGLMRTNPESENLFFFRFINSGLTFMNFMNCFEMAMEKQRHIQEMMDHKTIDTVLKLKTFLKIEHKCKDVDKCKDNPEEDDPVDLFFKKDGLCKNANVEMILQQYILRRWTKNLIPAALRNKRNIYGEKNVVVENFTNEASSIVDYCVHLLSKDEPRLGGFIEKLKSLKKYVEADCPNPPSKNKTDNLEQLIGVLKPPVVEVNNPTV
uniref:Protein FAR1-related sequence 5-like n=1 Tax=Tanacetum cinerariifolium TaxID=118510 RepID=A0A6L2LGK7_TANCI|nr:protein FAR1-related sequence 5-like [Tanacetum cinerariifolium]